MYRPTLGSSPVSLSDVESAPDRACVNLLGPLIDEQLFGLDDGTGLALVVDAYNLEGCAVRSADETGTGRSWPTGAVRSTIGYVGKTWNLGCNSYRPISGHSL